MDDMKWYMGAIGWFGSGAIAFAVGFWLNKHVPKAVRALDADAVGLMVAVAAGIFIWWGLWKIWLTWYEDRHAKWRHRQSDPD